MLAAAAWLSNRALSRRGLSRWNVQIALDVGDTEASETFEVSTATRFHIDIYSEEWGFFFCHQGRASWIRVTDIPFVHGRDDFGLLSVTPPLEDIGFLLRRVEGQHSITFRRDQALVHTNLRSAVSAIRSWVMSL